MIRITGRTSAVPSPGPKPLAAIVAPDVLRALRMGDPRDKLETAHVCGALRRGRCTSTTAPGASANGILVFRPRYGSTPARRDRRTSDPGTVRPANRDAVCPSQFASRSLIPD